MQDKYHEIFDKFNIPMYVMRMHLRVFLIMLNKNILIILLLTQ